LLFIPGWAASNFIPSNNNGLNNILLPQYGNNMINKHQFSTKVNNESTNYMHIYGSKIVSCLTISNFVFACVLYNIYSINKKLEMIPNKEIMFENFKNSKINFKNYLDEKKNENFLKNEKNMNGVDNTTYYVKLLELGFRGLGIFMY
jgi:hypothetical protein